MLVFGDHQPAVAFDLVLLSGHFNFQAAAVATVLAKQLHLQCKTRVQQPVYFTAANHSPTTAVIQFNDVCRVGGGGGGGSQKWWSSRRALQARYVTRYKFMY